MTISDLTIADGKSTLGNGGGVNNAGTLTLSYCTISGNSATNASSAGGGVNNAGTLTLSYCTISGNSVTGASSDGGGIYNASTLTVSHSTFSGNSAARDGGGIYNASGSGSTLTVSNSTFDGNTATGYGGGIYNASSNPMSVTDGALSGNSAGLGGGLFNGVGALTVTGGAFTSNTAGTDGGGIFNAYAGTLTVSNSTLDSNTVTGDPGHGGGIANDIGGTLTVTGSTLSNNSLTGANGNGGGIYNGASGTVTVSNSTLSSNIATVNGGGIYNSADGSSGGTVTVSNSTLSSNKATGGDGGGIYNHSDGSSGTVTVSNSTLSGNQADYSGGGIYNAGTLNYANTIIANSTFGGDCVNSGGTIGTNTKNLVEDGSCSSVYSGDPKLGALSGGVHVPQSDSPVIDAGDAATCAAAPISGVDQRGQARDDWQCDIGAVEVKLSDTDTVIKAVGGTGTYTFGPTLAKIQVNNVGSLLAAASASVPAAALTSLTVKRVDGNHPQAGVANLQTGHYWTITPSSGASGYNLDLTLPAIDFTPDGYDKLCRYTGSGWECAASGFDGPAKRITRSGVTQLSDWVAGDNVGPNAVTLRGFAARAGGGFPGAAAWAALAGGGLWAAACRRRRPTPAGQQGGRGGRPQPGPAEPGDGQPFPAQTAVTAAAWAGAYERPAISSRGQLKHFAGSPLLSEPLDPLALPGLGE
ncbi:MAG: right-handed parallel beta-helix repeat-containing protein [Caldilineales bacterium]|nr:right-handed parallel beta-helix repeat-containing protein [Caldilineales bacterium]